MIGTPRRAVADDRGWPGDRRPFDSPAGLPPAHPWLAAVLLGPGRAGLGAARLLRRRRGQGVLAWGTWLSWCFFAFAFLAHVSSATNALGQGSFPVYSRRTAVPMIAGSLAVLLYMPALLTLVDTAWPGSAPDRTRSVYLVNCWAYRSDGPRRGHWVWLRLPPSGRLHAARVVAVAGQEVEWTGHEWKVNGQSPGPLAPLRTSAWPLACPFKVPADQVLVEPEEDDGSPATTGSLVLVAQDQIIGRAWAQYYPVWDRRLL